MRKTKRIIILSILLLITTSLFRGCTGKDIDGVKASTPQEAIDKFNQYNTEGNIEEMVKLYSDVYVDSVGYSRKQISKMLKRNSSNIKVVKVESKSMDDISDTIKKATVTITSKEDNKDEVIIKDFKYKFYIISIKTFYSFRFP